MDTLLLELKNNDIDITIIDGNIQLDIPNDIDASDLIGKVKANKSALIKYFEEERRKVQSISKSPAKNYYALSAAQRRLHFLYELDKDSLAYNQFRVLELKGVLDRDKLERSFKGLLSRHEILRTQFELIDDEVYQRVLDEVSFEIEYHKAPGGNYDEVLTDFVRTFDLGVAPLFRVGVIELSSVSHVLVVDMHHIITDGTSIGLMIRDFMSLYEGAKLEALPLQYKDYSEWQQSVDYQDSLAIQKSYWLGEYSEEVSILELPTDYPRPEIKSYRGSNFSFTLSTEVTASLRSLGDKQGATLFMTLLSIFNVLLSKLSGQQDVVVGTGIAGRSHADLEDIVGMFVNTLALRNYPKWDLSFSDFLVGVKDNTLQGLEYQHYPYEELVSHLDLPRDTSRNPLFDVWFVLQNFEREVLGFSDLEVTSKDIEYHVSKFDLQLTGLESEESLHLDFEYSTDLFKEDTIARFAVYFKRIVDQVISNPDIVLGDIVLLDKKEEQVLLEDFNSTSVDYGLGTFLDLFDAELCIDGSKEALHYGDSSLSYSDLDYRSRVIACELLSTGVTKGSVVGVMLARSIDFIVSVLGILRSGCGFLSIDPIYPSSRKSHMISNSEMDVLITSDDLLSRDSSLIEDLSLSCLRVENFDYSKGLPSIDFPEVVSSDLAYVLYTSGSTGLPKGVMISHGSLYNYLRWGRDVYMQGADCSMALFSSISFDLTITSMLLPLVSGHSLRIYGDGDAISVLDSVIRDGYAKVLKLTPSHLQILRMEGYDLSGISCLIVGGGAIE